MVLFVLGLIGLTYWVVVDTYAPGVGRPGILRKIGSVVVLIVFTALVRVPAPHVTAQRRQKGQRHDLSGWHQTPDARQACLRSAVYPDSERVPRRLHQGQGSHTQQAATPQGGRPVVLLCRFL